MMTQKKYKAVFCDFDGTLFSDDYNVSEKNKQTIKDFIARGGKFFIATGRLFSSIRPYAIDLGLKKEIIVCQGSAIYDIETGKAIYSSSIEQSTAVRLLQKLENDEISVPMMYYNDNCYIQNDNEYTQIFSKITGINLIQTGYKLSEYLLKENITSLKILALVAKKLINGYSEDLMQMFTELTFQKSRDTLLEVVRKDVSKGNAVDAVCKKYNINKEDIICIGDADNDISMLDYAGLGVAPSNAMESAKAHADIIGVSNDEDCVACIIEKYCI